MVKILHHDGPLIENSLRLKTLTFLAKLLHQFYKIFNMCLTILLTVDILIRKP